MSKPQFCPYCGHHDKLDEDGKLFAQRGVQDEPDDLEVTQWRCRMCQNTFLESLEVTQTPPSDSLMIGQVYFIHGMLGYETIAAGIKALGTLRTAQAAKGLAKTMAQQIEAGFRRFKDKEKSENG